MTLGLRYEQLRHCETKEEVDKEAEANLFAYCLLMPEEEFKKQWKRYIHSDNKLFYLSQYFGVTAGHIIDRARQLSLED